VEQLLLGQEPNRSTAVRTIKEDGTPS